MFISVLVERLAKALGVRPVVIRFLETIATTAMVTFLTFFVNVITARWLGPEGRGELASITLVLQLAGILSASGLPMSTIYNIKKYPEQRPQLIAGSLILAVVLGSITAMFAWRLIPLWLSDYRPEVVLAAQIATCLAPFWTTMTIAQSILRGHDEFTVFNGVRVSMPVVTLIALVAIGASGYASPYAFASPIALACVIWLPWPLGWIFRNLTVKLAGTGAAMRQLLKYSSRSLWIDIVNCLTKFSDRLFIVAMLPPTLVGLYVVANGMARPLAEVGAAITLVLFPKASASNPEQAIELSALAGRVGLAILAGVAAVLLVVAPLLLELLFGKQFVPAEAAFRWILVAVVLNGVSDLLAQAFTATGRPGAISILRCIELALLVGLLLSLVPRYEMMGAAWSVLGVSVVRFISTLACYPLVLKAPLPRLYVSVGDIRRIRTSRRPAAAESPAE